jgi:hypothetical protein
MSVQRWKRNDWAVVARATTTRDGVRLRKGTTLHVCHPAVGGWIIVTHVSRIVSVNPHDIVSPTKRAARRA